MTSSPLCFSLTFNNLWPGQERKEKTGNVNYPIRNTKTKKRKKKLFDLLLTIDFGGFGIVDGARTHNDDETIILAVKNLRALITSLGRCSLRVFRLEKNIKC